MKVPFVCYLWRGQACTNEKTLILEHNFSGWTVAVHFSANASFTDTPLASNVLINTVELTNEAWHNVRELWNLIKTKWNEKNCSNDTIFANTPDDSISSIFAWFLCITLLKALPSSQCQKFPQFLSHFPPNEFPIVLSILEKYFYNTGLYFLNKIVPFKIKYE